MNDPRRTARLAGALWLVVIAGGVISFSTQSGMPVWRLPPICSVVSATWA